ALHRCGANTEAAPTTAETTPTHDSKEIRTIEHEEEIPVTAAPTPTASADSGDAFAAFQSLVASLAPKVDRDEVSAMIKAELDNVTVPTRTVVERATGECKVIPHSHDKLADVTTDLLAGEHVLMVGPAGTGKSTIAEQAADSIGVPYYSISLSPMTA